MDKITKNKLAREGEVRLNKQGCEMILIKYNSAMNCEIKFDGNDHTMIKSYAEFKRGTPVNPYHPTVYGKGYLGVGEYTRKSNLKINNTWRTMIGRCYYEYNLQKEPNYRGCTVCDEWLNFQNFAKWYEDNYYDDNLELELDKDILIKGNKVYSPETCVFVPKKINLLFVKKRIEDRGGLPSGVSMTDFNTYYSYCNYRGKRVRLGNYKNLEDAFQSYKIFKERYIKELANEYQGKIPNELYLALYNYSVEITD